MAIENEFSDALDQIDAIVSAPSIEGADAAVVSGQSLCERYQKIRQFLLVILPVIDKVPVWGKKVSNAIRFLMNIADSACPSVSVWGIVANGGGN